MRLKLRSRGGVAMRDVEEGQCADCGRRSSVESSARRSVGGAYAGYIVPEKSRWRVFEKTPPGFRGRVLLYCKLCGATYLAE